MKRESKLYKIILNNKELSLLVALVIDKFKEKRSDNLLNLYTTLVFESVEVVIPEYYMDYIMGE